MESCSGTSTPSKHGLMNARVQVRFLGLFRYYILLKEARPALNQFHVIGKGFSNRSRLFSIVVQRVDMNIERKQGEGSALKEPEQQPEQKTPPRFDLIRFLGDGFRESLATLRRLWAGAWLTLPTYLPFYLFVIVVGYAAWEAQTHVTVIAPFQLPNKADLPFSGEIVADKLQDDLTSIHNEIERERDDPRLRPTDMDLPDLRGIILPKFGRIEVPTRFAVEVKGLSYEGIISAARAVMGTETTISGDVILNGKEFILIARTADAGPWESASKPISAEGLKQAISDLAEQILATQEPTLAGAELLLHGQVDQALAVFNRERILKPTDVQLQLNLCTGFEANRRYKDAIDCYQGVLKNPISHQEVSEQEVSERLAQAYYLNGDRVVAINQFENLAHKQKFAGALLDLGKALDDTGKHQEALAEYDRFLGANASKRNLAIAHVNRGVALARLGKHDEALTEYKKSLQDAPGDVLILVSMAVEMAAGGDLDAGIAQLQNVVDEKGNADKHVNEVTLPFAYLRLGILFQDKADWRDAVDSFNIATERRPSYAEAHIRLAYSLAHEGRQSEALSEYATFARLSPSELDKRYSQVLANQWLGNALLEQGNYSSASSFYREAIRLKPDYRVAHCQLGLVLEHQGHLELAIQEYRAATLAKSNELDSSDGLVLCHLRLGEALLSKGRAHEAEGIDEFRMAIKSDPSHTHPEPYFCLGKTRYNEGSFDEAVSEFQGAIHVNLQSAAVDNGLALAFDKQGKLEQAASEFRDAVKLEPENAGYHANLAHELDLLHSDKEAAVEREKVAKLNSATVARRQVVNLQEDQRARCEDLR
jgi:tetratricopeptide (TPR) repeat protein